MTEDYDVCPECLGNSLVKAQFRPDPSALRYSVRAACDVCDEVVEGEDLTPMIEKSALDRLADV